MIINIPKVNHILFFLLFLPKKVYFDCAPFEEEDILEPRDQDIGGFYLVQERRATDFEAPKL